MNLNDLKMIIRSHECVRSGCQLVYPGEDNQLLMTLFSASNYGGQGNSAAFLVFEYSGENEAGEFIQCMHIFCVCICGRCAIFDC